MRILLAKDKISGMIARLNKKLPRRWESFLLVKWTGFGGGLFVRFLFIFQRSRSNEPSNEYARQGAIPPSLTGKGAGG
jgi:hypothetical protein